MVSSRVAVGMMVGLSSVGIVSMTAGATTKTSTRPSVAVVIEKTIEDSSCYIGVVKVASFLSVRTAPKAGAKELDRLKPGAKVELCEARKGFWGIVYGGEPGTCVPEIVKKAYSYTGPCRSGWVASKFVESVAG
jgi:hypothetical protein